MFYLRLSLQLGIPVDEMLERIDSRTLAEYMALEFIDPHGPIRGDIQAGVIASTIANVHRAKGPALSIRDFLPFRDAAGSERMPEADMRAQLMSLATMTGGGRG
jgi:hypothetical protein